MGLRVKINGVSVKAALRPSGYFFQLRGMLEAAGVPDGISKEMEAMCPRSGRGARRRSRKRRSGKQRFVSLDRFRDCAARVRGDGKEDAGEARRRLEACAAACADWIASREDAPAGKEAASEPVETAAVPAWDPYAGLAPSGGGSGLNVVAIAIAAARFVIGEEACPAAASGGTE